MSRRSRAVLLAALTACSGLSFSTAQGQAIINWGNASGGTFNVAGNWMLGVVPGASDTPVFSLNSTYNVLFTNSPTNANATLSTGSVTFASGGVVRSWTLTGNYTQSGGVASLSLSAQPVNLSIGGILVMSGGAQLFVSGGSATSVGTGTIANGSASTLKVQG